MRGKNRHLNYMMKTKTAQIFARQGDDIGQIPTVMKPKRRAK